MLNSFKKFINKMLTKKVEIQKEVLEEKTEEVIEETSTPVPYLIEDIAFNDELNLVFGMIILAKRYKNELEKESIPEGHRVGLYIVIGYQDDEYLCLQCSGTASRSFSYRTLKLIKEHYNEYLKKNTYVNISRYDVLTKDRIINVFCKLNEEDKNSLLRKIEIVENEGLYVEYNIHLNPLPLDNKDVIKYNDKMYAVIKKDNTSCELIKIQRNEQSEYLLIDDIRYEFFLNDIITILESDYPLAKRHSVLDDTNYSKLKQSVTKHKEYLERKKIIKRGSLVNKEGVIIYVNGEEGEYFLGFRVYKTKQEDMADFYVGKTKCYSNFTDYIRFKKNDETFKIVDLALEEQMDIIKQKKKNYTKTHDKEEQKNYNFSKKPNIVSGSFVEEILANKKKYLVIDRINEGVVIAIKEENIYNGNYELVILKVKDINYTNKRMNPEAFKDFLISLSKDKKSIKGVISKDNLKLLINRYDFK